MAGGKKRTSAESRANFLRWLELEHELADKQLEAFRTLLLEEGEPQADAAIERLIADVVQHLETEEQDLFPWLLETVPHVAFKVERLRSDHARLLTAMQEARAARGPLRKAALARLEHQLDRHAAEERQLATEALVREEDALDW